MSFGTLDKLKTDIEEQADEIRKARHVLNIARNELSEANNKDSVVYRMISEALEILTRLAN